MANLNNCATADHFSISHDGAAINCLAEPIVISAHDASDVVDTSYAGTITLSTDTAHGDWSLLIGSGTLTNNGAGSADYVFDAADNGEVTLGLANTFAETVNINVADAGISEDPAEDPTLTFAAAGFNVLANNTPSAVGTQIAGKASSVAPNAQTLELQAIETDPNTGECQAALVGPTTVELGYQCLDPAACTASSLTVSGNPIASNNAGTVSNYTNVSLDFGDATDATATITLTYPEAGQIQLHARYKPATGQWHGIRQFSERGQ